MELGRQNTFARKQRGIDTLPQPRLRLAKQIQQAARASPLAGLESFDVVTLFGLQLVEMHEYSDTQLILIEDCREKRRTQIGTNHSRANLFVNFERLVQIFSRMLPIARVIVHAREIIERSTLLQTVAERG